MGQACRVFLDESGKIYNLGDPAPTLAAVFIPDEVLDGVRDDFAKLEESAKHWGADTDDPKFEFCARRLLSTTDSNRDYFARVSSEHADKILKKMALIIARHRLLTLTTCFNRPQADRSAESVFNGVPGGYDRKVCLPGLFFGLVAGMCAKEDLDAVVVADKDFIQGSFWHDALRATREAWPHLKGKGLFSTWAKYGEPEWRLSGDIETCESFQEYGIQLADLLANTIRRVKRRTWKITPYHELQAGSLKEAPGFKFGFPGVDAFLQMHKDATRPPWRDKQGR
jgi:hypothetical protein